MNNSIFLKISSAVALGGVIHRAGSIVEVGEDVAKDLLRRGRAELYTEADAPAPESEKAAKPPKKNAAAE